MRFQLIITGAVLTMFGIPGYLYAPNLMSKFMYSYTGTSGSSAMATNVLQQIGIPPIQVIDQWMHYSFVGLAIAGVLLVVLGIFTKKSVKQFSGTNAEPEKSTENSQEDQSKKILQILKERLARGEITPDDFVDLKKLLE